MLYPRGVPTAMNEVSRDFHVLIEPHRLRLLRHTALIILQARPKDFVTDRMERVMTSLFVINL